MGAFKIGINMAGAVSAGAYTAGALDFLIQALDEWYAAKARGEAVPMHDVSIEVLSGASAGGMCAAIGGISLHEQFTPVEKIGNPGAAGENKLYGSWVQKIDISAMLGTEDLKNDGPVVSVLDSTTLDEIAGYALTPGARQARKYVSDNLNLFLTLTNLRGVVYDIDPANGGTFEEQIAYHADYLQFEMLPQPGAAQTSALAEPLPLSEPETPAWRRLQQAALATGAFPLVLAPRILDRKVSDYDEREWVMGDAAVKIPADWGKPAPVTFSTVNVDGGVTNNNPFELCRNYLAGLKPRPADGRNIRDPMKADRAVITIAPFPGTESYSATYDANEARSLFRALGALLQCMVSQSRFSGESISLLKADAGASRFVIAPSDERAKDKPALMCDALSAFAGFLSRKFRDRDYQLGRRNCQQFLRQYFVLPADNPVIADGLAGDRDRLIAKFKARNDDKFPRPDPKQDYLPIIPAWGRAATDIVYPERDPMPESALRDLCGRAADRLVAVAKKMLQEKASWWMQKSLGALMTVCKGWIKSKLQNLAKDGLLKVGAVEEGK